MHARVKILFTLVFILALNFLPQHAWAGFILFFTLTISTLILSRVDPRIVLKRSLAAIPFIISAVPLIFWGPDPSVVWDILGMFSIPVSVIGVERCLSIIIKAWISILAAIILTATTDSHALIAGFRQLGIPAILVSVVELMWRYLFVMVDEVTRLIRARNSRSTVVNHGHHAGGSVLWRAEVTGNMAGSLFLRSIERSERVYAAMLSRGYNGEPFSEPGVEFTSRDRLSVILGVLVILILLFAGFLTGR
jgi:cobalt/nickel transport system permease protein